MTDRIEALERALAQLAEQLLVVAQAATAQAVIARAVVDLTGRAGATIEDVRDRAVEIGDTMPGEIGAAVRTILADAPASAETLQ